MVVFFCIRLHPFMNYFNLCVKKLIPPMCEEISLKYRFISGVISNRLLLISFLFGCLKKCSSSFATSEYQLFLRSSLLHNNAILLTWGLLVWREWGMRDLTTSVLLYSTHWHSDEHFYSQATPMIIHTIF